MRLSFHFWRNVICGWIGFTKKPGVFTQIRSNRPDACPSRGTENQTFCAVLKYKKYNPSAMEGFRWIERYIFTGNFGGFAGFDLVIVEVHDSPGINRDNEVFGARGSVHAAGFVSIDVLGGETLPGAKLSDFFPRSRPE